MTTALAPVFQQLIPTMGPSVEQLLREMAALMTPTMDSLINQLIPLKSAEGGNLTATLTSGVIEAVVLASTRLATSQPNHKQTIAQPGNTTTPSNAPQFKVSIDTGKQILELTTQAALPAGTKILLKLASNNLANIVRLGEPNQNLQTKATMAESVQSQLQRTTLTDTVTVNTTKNNHDKSLNSSPKTLQAAQNKTILEQGLREALPRQQSLRLLVPILQTLSQQAPTNLPKELTLSLKILLQQFSSPQQLQQPQHLKRVINQSGIFFETKLAQSLSQQSAKNASQTTLRTTPRALPLTPALNAPSPTDKPVTNAPRPDPAIQRDLKGLLQRILPMLTELETKDKTSNNTEAAPAFSPALTKLNTALNHTQAGNQTDKNQNLDVMLRQLSSQLLASLARTQMNQMESLGARQANNPEGQGPVNSWNLELPIVHGKNVDNLELHIEQHLVDEQSQQQSKKDPQKLWVVMLAFDLHSLGKMNVQLKILNNTVAATVWSQQENTHREVKQQVQQLKKQLEKVGVTVQQLDCQLGLPPKNTLPIYQQLVDVHT